MLPQNLPGTVNLRVGRRSRPAGQPWAAMIARVLRKISMVVASHEPLPRRGAVEVGGAGRAKDGCTETTGALAGTGESSATAQISRRLAGCGVGRCHALRGCAPEAKRAAGNWLATTTSISISGNGPSVGTDNTRAASLLRSPWLQW